MKVDIGAIYGQYHADYGRTWVVGKATSQQIVDHDITVRATHAALEANAPGVTPPEITKLCFEELKKAGVKEPEVGVSS